MESQAFVYQILLQRGQTRLNECIGFALGLSLLISMSHVSIPLSFTPVPITGQTFAVLLIALLWGQKKSFAIVSTYLIMGVFQLPVFAVGAGFLTYGYLMGMLLACAVVGYGADRGWASSWMKTFALGTLGTALIFTLGLFWLSFFTPMENLLMLGLIPFLPGAFIKIALASGLCQILKIP